MVMLDANMILRYLLNDNADIFVDCVLYAYHKVKDIEIATFDKKTS